jgi:hypothetical protein
MIKKKKTFAQTTKRWNIGFELKYNQPLQSKVSSHCKVIYSVHFERLEEKKKQERAAKMDH